jgi:hypothetical protein
MHYEKHMTIPPLTSLPNVNISMEFNINITVKTTKNLRKAHAQTPALSKSLPCTICKPTKIIIKKSLIHVPPI